jgi:hypothetical protein
VVQGTTNELPTLQLSGSVSVVFTNESLAGHWDLDRSGHSKQLRKECLVFLGLLHWL